MAGSPIFSVTSSRRWNCWKSWRPKQLRKKASDDEENFVSYAPAQAPFGRTAWLVVIVASIGFLFDTYELLMTPLILAPALSELLRVPPNHPEVTAWVGRILWMTALCGGIFGLWGGWLVDRLGRKSVMVGSIFVYSLSPVLAGL